MSETPVLSWRQAREILMESGHGVNDAQAILEDLAHWGPTSAFSVKTETGVMWLHYAGLRPGAVDPEWELLNKREQSE